MPDLLLELRSEEIPARMQATGAESLRREVEKRLQAQELSWKEAEAYATPRRLALIVRGLPDEIPKRQEVLRGPRVSAPETAVEGFLRSAGVMRETLTQQGQGKKAVWFAIREIPTRTLDDVLVEILPGAIRAVHWPKSMRWGRNNFRWVRPLRGILCIVGDGDASRSVALDIEGIPCGSVTRGHPQMAPEEFTIRSVDSYEFQLEQARVIVNAETRRERIETEAQRVANDKDLKLLPDPELLEEIVGLVEWPVVFGDKIEDTLSTRDRSSRPFFSPMSDSLGDFSTLPPFVLNASMRKHQKFLPLWDQESKWVLGFVGVADIEASDGGEQMQAGYRRVLYARLKDAQFFWRNDQDTELEGMYNKLSGMVFHTGLGNMQQRAKRISTLARKIAPVFDANPEVADRAGRFSKADLCSDTVREFPELQGFVGGWLASTICGGDEEVGSAIENQYRTEDNPIGCARGAVGEVGSSEQIESSESDSEPRGNQNNSVAALIVADRIDTLWGFFATGERPTSSRDPYALRRAALVVLRTLIENERPISLRKLFELAEQGYEEHGDMPSASREDASSSLREFMLGRLRVDLRDGAKYGYRHDMIIAAALQGAEDSPVQLKRRAEALNLLFVKRLDPGLSKQADAMLTAWRRCASILDAKDEPENGGMLSLDDYDPPMKEETLTLELKQVQKIDSHRLNDPFAALNELKKLYEAVDPFFEKVKVNDNRLAIRKHRRRLLTDVRTVLEKVADFKAIEG